MLYYILFAIIAVLGFLEQFGKSYKNGKIIRFLFSIFVLTIFVLSALRWERGTDWNSYLLFFMNPWSNWDTHYEWGFAVLNLFFRSFTDNYSVFLAFQTGLYLFLSVIIFKKIEKDYPDEKPIIFSLLLYQFTGTFAGLFTTRSQIAGIICVLALYEIREKHFWKYCLLIGVAALFHTSSLALLIAYPIFYMKINDILFYCGLIIVSVIVSIFPGIVTGSLASFSSLQRYRAYINIVSAAGITIGILKWILLWGVSLYIYNKKTEKKWIRGYTRIIAIGTVIYFWSTIYGSVLNRMSGLFFSAVYFIIPELIYYFKDNRKVMVYLLFIMWCAISFYIMFNGNYHPLYEPYKSIFDDFSVITSVNG